jgi:hypothetical protein
MEILNDVPGVNEGIENHMMIHGLTPDGKDYLSAVS